MNKFYGPAFLPADQTVLSSGQSAVEYVVLVMNQSAFFVFSIDRSFFDESLKAVIAEICDAYTFIDWNYILLYSNTPPEFTIDIPSFPETDSARLETYYRDNLFISHLTSSDTNLTYISVIDEKLLLKKANALSKQFVALDILILLLGFTITFFLTRQHYKPIRRLLDSLNQFGLITSKEMHALDRVAMGMNLPDAHNKQLGSEKCLLKLLSGTYKSIGDFNENSPYQINPAHDRCVLITLSWEGLDSVEEENRKIMEMYRDMNDENIEPLALEHEWQDMYLLIAFFSVSAEEALREKLTWLKDRLDDHHLLLLPLTYTIAHAFRKTAGTYHIVTLTTPATKTGLIEFMLTLTGEITGLIQLREVRNTQSMQDIAEYIRLHYQEYDLTVSSAADYFHLSVSNLSHQFKNVTPKEYRMR